MKDPKVHAACISIELTNYCNFQCQFCPDHLMKRKRGFMDENLARKILDQIDGKTVISNEVTFHVMGEPLLHPKVFSIVNYACQKGLRCSLVTNGFLLTSNNIDKLLQCGLKWLVLSCQTPSEESFAHYRSENLSFSAYLSGIRECIFKKCKTRSEVEIEIHHLNTKHIQPNQCYIISSEEEAKKVISEWVGFAENVEHRLQLKPFSREKNYRNILDDLSKEWEMEILSGVKLVFKRASNFSVGAWDKRIIPRKRRFCGTNQLAILWDGQATICCVDYEGGINIGNANTQLLKEIYLGQKARGIREAMKRGILIEPTCQVCKGTPVSFKHLINAFKNRFIFLRNKAIS